MPTSADSDPTISNNTVKSEILSVLRCPITRSELHQEGDWLIAEVGGLSYPVREGIPVMLPEEAKLPAGVSSLEEVRERFGK